nr:uncharacterized protein LOC127328988 [Lolium perenne]
MPDEHRPPATGTPPTPTEACPAAHAARGIAATQPRSRSRRSGFHAQQADPSRQPVAVPRRWDKRPARPEPRRHPCTVAHLCHRPVGTGKGRRTPASLPHTVALRNRPELRPPRDRHAKEELGRHIPVATASPGPLPRHPLLRPAVGAEDADRPPLPAARCRGHGLDTTNAIQASQGRRPGLLERGRPGIPQIERISIWEDADQAAPQGPVPRATAARTTATSAAPASSHHRSPPPEPAGSASSSPGRHRPHEPALHRAPGNPRPPSAAGCRHRRGRRPPAAAAGEAQAGRSFGGARFRPWRRLGERREGELALSRGGK